MSLQGAREEGPADMAKVMEDSQVSGTRQISSDISCASMSQREDFVWKTPPIFVSKLAELILGLIDVMLPNLAEKKGSVFIRLP